MSKLEGKLFSSFCVRSAVEVWTPVWLVSAGLVLLLCQLFSPPITCHPPAHFTGAHISYAHKVCWATGRMYMPFEDAIPKEDDTYDRVLTSKLYFYMPFFLFAQAAFLCLPRLLWTVLSRHPGIPLGTLTSAARGCLLHTDAGAYQTAVAFLGRRLGHHLQTCRAGLSEILTLFNTYLSIAYLLAALARVVVAGLVLAVCVGTLEEALDVRALISGQIQSSYLPSVVLCDYQVRRLGNVQRYTVQCSLNNSTLYHGIVMLLCVWYSFLVTAALSETLEYFVRSLFAPCLSNGTVAATLAGTGRQAGFTRNFVDYLGRDGILIARLVEEDSNGRVAADMLGHAWDYYQGNAGTGGTELANMPATPVQGQGASGGQEPQNVYPKLG